MNSICHQCALRIQRVTQVAAPNTSKRAFSSTKHSRRSMPAFVETSNEELNTIISTFREKHLLPATLKKSQRKIIYSPKNKQLLEDNPRTVTFGKLEMPLKYIDIMKEVPSKKSLLNGALEQIVQGGDSQHWANLAPLLESISQTMKQPLPEAFVERVIRKAVQANRLGAVVQCLQQVDRTGLSLRDDRVLKMVLAGVRSLAQQDNFAPENVHKALKISHELAALMELEAHGGGRAVREDDARARPEVIAPFVELVALYVKRAENGGGSRDTLKAYATRLMSCIGRTGLEPNEEEMIPKSGPQYKFLSDVCIWNSLHLAQKVLGRDMPQANVASSTQSKFEASLVRRADALKSTQPTKGSYDAEALHAWTLSQNL